VVKAAKKLSNDLVKLNLLSSCHHFETVTHRCKIAQNKYVSCKIHAKIKLTQIQWTSLFLVTTLKCKMRVAHFLRVHFQELKMGLQLLHFVCVSARFVWRLSFPFILSFR